MSSNEERSSATTTTLEPNLQKASTITDYLPPTPVWLTVASAPCFVKAWRDYKAPILSATSQANLMNESAEEGVRRVAASQIATRALRVATAASFGVTLLGTALGMTVAGYTTLGMALQDVRRRRHVLFGESGLLDDNNAVAGALGWRPDRSHADFQATRDATEHDELEYLAETYFPGEDWTQPDGKIKHVDNGTQDKEAKSPRL